MPSPASRRLVFAIIALHLLIGLVYSWATPVLEASDEGYHFAAIRWMALGNGLPVQQVGEERDWEQEGSQPPLYYWLGAGLTALAGTPDYDQVFVQNPLARVGVPGTTHNVNLYRHPLSQPPLTGTVLAVYLIRWLSLLMSAGTIWLTAVLALRVFPGREAVAVLAAALVAFNPMALFINAAINNDNLVMLLTTAALVLTLDFMPAEVKNYRWKAAGLGLLLGLAALTKVSGLLLWPIAAAGVGWGAWRGRNWRHFVVSGVLILFGALLVSSWWFWRNSQLYGEWLGLDTMVAVAGAREPALTVWQLVTQEWNGFWLSYWGVFGTFNVLAGSWVYWLFTALTLGGVAGGLYAWWRVRGWPTPEVLILILFCLLTLVGLMRWTLMTLASQGRLMFGAIAPLSILMAAGLLRLVEAARARTVSRMLAALLATASAVVPVLYIAPRYAPPPIVAEDQLPSDLHELHARFGESMELIGYAAGATPRRPGETQTVTLYWRALSQMQQDYALALHLLGQGSAEIGKIDTWPGGGTAATSFWQPGMILADSYQLPITTTAATPSLTRLAIDVWDSDPANQLPITAPDGQPAETVAVTVGRVVPAAAPEFSPTRVEGSTFEHGIQLLGLDVGASGAADVTLYWKPTGPVPGDYTVFLHLVDSSGVQVTQADAPPLNGDWPTSAWAPGLAFADRRLFELPPGLPRGLYTLQLGFYDPASGARLLAFKADGSEWQDDVVIVADAVVIP